MTPPRLIFVNRVYHPAEAATAQLLTDLTTALAARGHDVHVVAAGPGPTSHLGVTVHRTGDTSPRTGLLAKAGDYTGFIRGARRILARLVRSGDVVVLKTDPPLLAAFATALVRRLGGRTVQWVQDIYPEIIPRHLGAWAAPLVFPLQAWRNRAWRNSAAVVCVGEDMAATLHDAGVPPDRTAVLPNWAPRELDLPPDPASVHAQRARWGLEGRLIAAYSGNLGRVHEFATLLDAARRLRDRPEIAFLFIGSGPRYAAVQAAARREGLPNVFFQPPQARADLAVSLAAADAHFVTLLPGYERLVNPSKLAGVMAAGRPALFVGTPACANARMLAEAGAGWSFSPGDSAGLADRLISLQADPALRAQTGAAARRLHGRNFAFAASVTHWEDLLRRSAAPGKGDLPSPRQAT